MLSDGQLTEILVLEVSVDFGLLSVVGVLELQLSIKLLLVLVPGVSEVDGILDLV